MAKNDLITIDFETKPIAWRPRFPPDPVGVSIKYRGKAPRYFGWGHPTKNNSTKAHAKEALRDAYRSGLPLLFHNAKFDADVAEVHFGLKLPSWERTHDTLYQLFLHTPHARSLSLKPASAELLGMKPEERDLMFEWLVAQGVLKKTQMKKVGEHIWECPGDLVGAYCNGDVIRTEKLHDFLMPKISEAGMLKAYDRERRLMPIMLANEREGLRVNQTALARDLKIYEAAQAKADAWLRKRLKVKDLNVDSDEEVADALDRAKIVTEWVLTSTGRRSIAKKNITAEMFKDKHVYYALGYRNRAGTCMSMFMRPWLEMAQSSGGIIYTNWNQVRQSHGDEGNVGARTGRLSCSPNFQNIPKDWYDKNDGYSHPRFLRVAELPMMRKYILPDKGGRFGHRDYNQQEPRILAHFENDKLCAQYNEDASMDVHQYAKEQIKAVTGKDMERRAVKITMLGEIYGRGTGSLAEALHITYDEAKRLKAALLSSLPGLRELNDAVKARGRSGKPIRTWGGRLYYVEPPMMINGQTRTFEYKLLNYLIQGSASDCIKEAIIRYAAMRKHGRFMVAVHDECNISAPVKVLSAEMKILKDAMESVEFDVPMKTDAKTGPNWGALTQFKETT